MERICPIMTRCDNPKADLDSGYIISCQQGKCALWIIPYTTEKMQTSGMCAFEMIAMKNSEGLYKV
jgi:hypothetical protein